MILVWDATVFSMGESVNELICRGMILLDMSRMGLKSLAYRVVCQ